LFHVVFSTNSSSPSFSLPPALFPIFRVRFSSFLSNIALNEQNVGRIFVLLADPALKEEMLSRMNY